MYISSDSNIWIDFMEIGHLDHPFRLEYQYSISRSTFDDEIVKSDEMRSRLLELGLSLVDITDDEYSDSLLYNGNSELAAGKFLSTYPRESYSLATKFPGYDPSNMGKVAEIFEQQLQKCQTPYFDFYLFHNVYEGNVDDYLDPKFGIMDYLLEQKRNGRIRHLGFSAHGSAEVIRRFLDAYGEHMEFCQLQLNYMDWHFQKAEEKVGLIREAGLPVWVMEPLRGGKLAKVSDEMTAALTAMRPDETIPAWAFRFLQSIPGVTMVLSGMSSLEQLRANIATWQEDKPLTEAETANLLALIDEETRKGGLPCTACHYCTSHCPKHLPIPDLIALYNEHKLTGGGFIAPSSRPVADDHIVDQIIEDVASVHMHFRQGRNDTIDSEGLFAQLSCFNNLASLKGFTGFGSNVLQVLSGHVPAFPVRAEHFIPLIVGSVGKHDLCAFAVTTDPIVIGARTGTQIQWICLRCHFIDHRAVFLRDQFHTRRYGGGHRRFDDVAILEICPFPLLIKRMGHV